MPLSENVREWPRERIGRVARLVELESISLIRCSAFRTPETALDAAERETQWAVLPFGPRGLIEPDTPSAIDVKGKLEVVVSFDLGRRDEQDTGQEDNPVDPEISASFMLTYTVQGGTDERVNDPVALDPEDVWAFSAFNATYNAWPYWREFAQSMSGRLGLPTLTIPILPVPNLSAPMREAERA